MHWKRMLAYIPASSASAWDGNPGTSPLSSITRWAICCRIERCSLRSVSVIYVTIFGMPCCGVLLNDCILHATPIIRQTCE